MKFMRKILALVLVLATLASFMLVAGAAKFTDAKNITHSAAVNVLSGVGVITGYENGSFKPTSSVTRAEMAKMLSFVMNGGIDVGETYTAACTFADSQNHWAKGYIGFCVSVGLINGKNASTFDPEGKVTGYEVSKMLLCALGYKADLNGLTGANWNTNAHGLAVKAKLLDSLVEYKPANPLNRDDSCQMILNALQATKVETTGSVLDIAGMTIVQNVDNVQLANTSSSYNGKNDGLLQLVEDVFPALRLVAGTANDPYGRPASEWTYKGASLGISAMKPLITTETIVNGKTILAALGGAEVKSAEVFINGTSAGTVTVDNLCNTTGLNLAQIKGQDMATTAIAIYNSTFGNAVNSLNFPASVLAQLTKGYTGNMFFSNQKDAIGDTRVTRTLHSEMFFDELTGKFTLINSPVLYGKVMGVRADVTDAEGNVTVPGYILVAPQPGAAGGTYICPTPYADIELDDGTIISGSGYLPILMSDVNLGEDENPLKIGDYVRFYVGCVNRGTPAQAYCAEGAAPMVKKTVTLNRATRSSYNGSVSNYDTIRDTEKVSYYAASSAGEQSLHTVGETYDIWYTEFGGRKYYYKSTGSTGNYMYLYNADLNTNVFPSVYEAKLVKADGSIEIVQTDVNYGPRNGGKNLVGSIVTATTNAAGQTVLTATGKMSGNFATVSVKNSQANVTFDSVTEKADLKTRFIIGQLDSNNNEYFTTYVGINKVPNVQSTANTYYAYTTNELGTLDTVFILNATNVASATQQGFVFKRGGADIAVTTEDGTYYELPAWLNGELTTLKLTDTAYNKLTGDGFHLFNAYTTNHVDYISSLTTFKGTAITQFTPADAGNIFINNAPITYHSNVLVFTYSMTNKTVAASSVEALYGLDRSTYTSFYTLHEDQPNKPLAAIFAIIP